MTELPTEIWAKILSMTIPFLDHPKTDWTIGLHMALFARSTKSCRCTVSGLFLYKMLLNRIQKRKQLAMGIQGAIKAMTEMLGLSEEQQKSIDLALKTTNSAAKNYILMAIPISLLAIKCTDPQKYENMTRLIRNCKCD